MTPDYSDDAVTVYGADCLEVLRELPDGSVDSVATDPPYGLGSTSGDRVADTVSRWVSGDREFVPKGPGFMGRAWDGFVPPVAVWDECLRVLRPGGHLLAFAGSRTLDLMTLGVRLAGFDVRDSIIWMRGNGFPKSRDVTEPMERFLAGDGPSSVDMTDVYTVTGYLRAARDAAGWSNRDIDALFGTNGMAGHWTTGASQPAVPSVRQWEALKSSLGTLGDDCDELVAELASVERPEDWGASVGDETFLGSLRKDRDVPPAGGWGTALKPGFDPIVVARKPTNGSTTANVSRYGTGALNIDGCRTGGGKWPANVALEGSVVGAVAADMPGHVAPDVLFPTFRYGTKATTDERVWVDGVGHPTVKPLDLMRWLVRLVTPPGGLVLDPFAGSGTTGEACVAENFRCVLVERDAEYLRLIRARLERPIAMVLEGL